MLKCFNNKGFTLIEVIITVVILSVLMAVTVPTVLKYINQGDESQAITEAYACVSAGDYYGIRAALHDVKPTDKVTSEIIQKKAGVMGSVISFSYDAANNTITELLYNSNKNVMVTYTGKEYVIGKELGWSVDRYFNQLKDIEKEHSLVSPGTIPPKKSTQDLQEIYKEKNNGQYPKLTQHQIDFMLSQGYNYNATDTDTLVWKPMYASDGTLVLFADSRPSQYQAMSPMIYFKGQYYIHVYTYGSSPNQSNITAESVLESNLIIKDGLPYDPDEKNDWILAQ